MRGAKLARFCQALCAAIARGVFVFEFEGRDYTVSYAQEKANEWLVADEELTTRRDDAVVEAEFAFWDKFAEHFPEATSGDFDPLESFRLTESMDRAAKHWLACNHPELEEKE